MNKFVVTTLLLVVALIAGCATDSDPNKDAIRLIQSKRGAAIAIQDRLLFDVGSAALRSESGPVMDRVAEVLKGKKKSPMLIEGHTDNQGTSELNLKLSENRAIAVKQALVTRGVDASTMTTKGYGFQEPIDSNATAEGRQRNRRAEIVFPGTNVADLKKDIGDKFNFGSVVKDALNSIKKIF